MPDFLPLYPVLYLVLCLLCRGNRVDLCLRANRRMALRVNNLIPESTQCPQSSAQLISLEFWGRTNGEFAASLKMATSLSLHGLPGNEPFLVN